MLQNSKEKFGTKVKFVQGRINWTPCKRYLKKKKKAQSLEESCSPRGVTEGKHRRRKKKS